MNKKNFIIYYTNSGSVASQKVTLPIEALIHNPYFSYRDYQRRKRGNATSLESFAVVAGVREILTDALGRDDVRVVSFRTS